MRDDVVTAAEHASVLEEREQLKAAVVALRALIQSMEGKTAALESALIQKSDEIQLLMRRLYGTKSERGGTRELQLLLAGVLPEAELQAKLDALQAEGAPEGDDEPDDDDDDEPIEPVVANANVRRHRVDDAISLHPISPSSR